MKTRIIEDLENGKYYIEEYNSREIIRKEITREQFESYAAEARKQREAQSSSEAAAD